MLRAANWMAVTQKPNTRSHDSAADRVRHRVDRRESRVCIMPSLKTFTRLRAVIRRCSQPPDVSCYCWGEVLSETRRLSSRGLAGLGSRLVFCCTLTIRRSRSDPLLVKGTARSVMKRSTSSRRRRSRLTSLRCGERGGRFRFRESLPLPSRGGGLSLSAFCTSRSWARDRGRRPRR